MQMKTESLIPKWHKPAAALAYIAALLFVAGLIYWGSLATGGRLAPQAYAKPADLTSILEAVETGRVLFTVGLWVFVIVSFARWPRVDSLGWLMFAVGGGLYLLSGIVLRRLAPGIDFAGLDSPGRLIYSAITYHSAGLAIIGLVRGLIGFILGRAYGPAAGAPAASSSGKDSPRTASRRCWEMSFCRSNLRNDCPAFRKQTPCWKLRSGCYCQGEVANTLAAAQINYKYDSGPGPTPLAQAALRSAGSRPAASTTARHKPPCIRCPIYQQHQQHKFRLVAWAVYPLVIFLTWLLSESLRRTWEDFDIWLSDIFNTVSILPTPTGPGIRDLSGTTDLSWVFIIIVGLILATILLKISEWLVIKKGL